MTLNNAPRFSEVSVPSNLSIPQFLLDEYEHPTRPRRPVEVPCVVDDSTGKTVFMDDLRRHTAHLAAGIRDVWNITEGEIVSIMSFNHPNYAPCVWGTHRLGGVVATLSPILSVGEAVHHLNISRPSLLIVHPHCIAVALQAASAIQLPTSRIVLVTNPSPQATTTHGPTVALRTIEELLELGSRCEPVVEKPMRPGEAKHRIAFLTPSSGTTGLQKAVAISHYNAINVIIQIAYFNRIGEDYAPVAERRFRPGDVCCGFLPLYHIYGLVYNLHFILYAGMTLVLAPAFHFESFLKSIERYQITHLTIVPPQAVLFCKHPAVKKYSLSSVRYCVVAAAPLSATLTSGLLKLFPNAHLGQGYGMTESCGTISMFPLTQRVGTLGSGGQLLPGTVAKVVKEDGSIAAVGEVGELYVQGGQIALGYYGNADVNKETFKDGWLRTGDQVFFNDRGDIFIVERIKELIKVKGLQVAPAELEGYLLTHDFIADAAVVGVADEYAGELPFAFIVLQPELAAAVESDAGVAEEVKANIFKFVADGKSRHKWLFGGIEFIDSIPRNGSGKILRRILREKEMTTSQRNVSTCPFSYTSAQSLPRPKL
ncbi:phenylacetyl-CoA ligase [Marasmius fiardii PR-910]|nr:phenylacetyl-CoA ligase [Marasmius fiardii PR-910]